MAGGFLREYEIEPTIPRNEFEAILAGGRRTQMVHATWHEDEVAATRHGRTSRSAPSTQGIDAPLMTRTRSYRACAGERVIRPAGTHSSAS